MERPEIALCLLALLLGSTLPTLLPPANASSNPTHSAIVVNGNTNFTPQNGVTGGSGTPADPFVIEGWIISFQAVGIQIINTDAHFVIRDIYIYSSGFGITLLSVANGRLENIRISNIGVGIVIRNSSGIVLNNSIVSGSRDEEQGGLAISDSTNVTLSHNRLFSNSGSGIKVDSSSNTTISGNRIYLNGHDGIRVFWSQQIAILGNNVALSNGYGMFIHCTTYATVSANVLTKDGLRLECFTGSDVPAAVEYLTSNTITVDNLVNGRPLLFYKNCADVDIDGVVVGQLIVVNCRRIRFAGLEIANTERAIYIAFVSDVVLAKNTLRNNDVGVYIDLPSSNVTLSDNVVSLNGVGIFAYSSSRFTASGNSILSNSDWGVNVQFSTSVSLLENDILRNGQGLIIWRSTEAILSRNIVSSNKFSGIIIDQSSQITISEDIASGNGWDGIAMGFSITVAVTGTEVSSSKHSGVSLHLSSGVLVYHNNFLGNTIQAIDDQGSQNSWDSGYPAGGNFWSDYAGIDSCNGASQDVCPPSDGIGDSPYFIDSDSLDRYPLVTNILL